MLLPTFGDGRLPGKQSAEILKRNLAGNERQCGRANGYRHGLLQPSTPRRHYVLYAQRHATTPRHNVPPPPRQQPAIRLIFMVRLTLRRR
jgi:hypothetical protein